MADVFISYKKEDRVLAERVEAALLRNGFTVWWDKSLTPRENWDVVVEREATAAKAILVIWTPRAVVSEWVRIEASFGKERRKLVPIMAEKCELPLFFKLTQFADVRGWAGEDSHSGWRQAISWISDLVYVGGRAKQHSVQSPIKQPGYTAEAETRYDHDHEDSDLSHRLLSERIIHLNGPVDDRLAVIVTSQLLYLESKDPNKNVDLYINSAGGAIESSIAIQDTIEYIKCPVSTICIGDACGMASLVLCSGCKGARSAISNSRITVNQIQPSFKGVTNDIEEHAKEVLKIKRYVTNAYFKHTKLSSVEIEGLLDRGLDMTPEQANNLGFIDNIFEEIPHRALI